jgi:hypothetical protein
MSDDRVSFCQMATCTVFLEIERRQIRSYKGYISNRLLSTISFIFYAQPTVVLLSFGVQSAVISVGEDLGYS